MNALDSLFPMDMMEEESLLLQVVMMTYPSVNNHLFPFVLRRILILHFDNTYLFQRRLLSLGDEIDLRDIKPTHLMCSWDTLREIDKRMPHREKAVSFLGKGDYHYATYLFLERLDLPFVLVVLDNHLDGRETFEGYISCGSWLREATGLPHLRRVVLITPQIHAEKKDGKIFEVRAHQSDKILSLTENYPIYLSIDKDVLDKSHLNTNWDQGNLTFKNISRIIRLFPPGKIMGVDICGEPEGLSLYEHTRSEEINLRLLRLILSSRAPGKATLPTAA
jgi:hypothetical protein